MTAAPQSPMGPDAEAYARRCLELSEITLRTRRVTADIAYGDDPLQKLDVIAPLGDPPRDGWPVLLFFHGGGFTHGYKEWGGFMAASLGDALLVLADYRLVPQVPPGQLLEDPQSALDWVWATIAEFGGDRARVHVGGHSAGGALAALLALRPQQLALASAVCLSTSFNRLAITATQGAAYALPRGPLPVDEDAPLVVARSGGTVPFLIGWGGRERQHARVERSSMAMVERLRVEQIPVEWLFLARADHFGTHLVFADRDHAWCNALRVWLDRDAADPV